MEKVREFIYKNRKKFVIAGILLFVLILTVSLIFLIKDAANSATLNVMVAPVKAKVVINGQEYGTRDEYKIVPGEYTAEISAEGFETRTASFTAKSGVVTNLWLYLEPEDGNTDWYYDNAEDGLIVGAIRNNYTLNAIEELKKDNPILDVLPVTVDYYTSDYSKRIWYTVSYEMAPEKTGFTITITDRTGGNNEAALNKIRELGFDPGEYEIVYRDTSKEYESYRAR